MDCSLFIQSIAVFCVNGTVMQDMNITLKGVVEKKHFESRYKKCELPLHSLKHQRFYFPFAYYTRINEKFCKSSESGWTSFQVHLQQVFCIKPSKTQRRYFCWTGPQINKLLKDKGFDHTLSGIQKVAWNAFRDVAHNFLGNTKAPNYIGLVEHMIDSYKNMGCNMSLKIHFLHSHLDFFPSNCGDVSDKHEEHFHQDITVMEKRYQGKWSPSMLANYCWTLAREQKEFCYSRKAKRMRL